MIMVAFSIVVLIGFIGLVVDLAHLMITKTELQNAADACALAAARELTGDANALVRAENAGIAVGTRNNVNLQGAAAAVLPDDITFSPTLSPNSSYLSRLAGADPVTAKYAMCTLPQSGIAMWFMEVMGFGAQTVNAMGVATLAPSQTNCAIPLGLCSKGPAPGYGMTSGDWLNGGFSAGGGLTGSFNWIDFTPPAGGETELAKLLTGQGQCNLTISNEVGQSGIMGNAIAKAWNSRFGLYQGGGGNPDLITAPPDFTGYSYTATDWPAQRDALSDFLSRRAANASYGDTADTIDAGNALTSLSISNAYRVSTHGSSGELAANGADRRLVTVPIVDCSGWASSQTVPIQSWACVLMLHPIGSPSDTVYMEYRGLSSTLGSPCATAGLGGGTVGPMVPVLVQ
jgi:hypothetical protein